MHFALYRFGVGMVQRESQPDVFLNGQGVQKIEVLEDKTQPLPAKFRQFFLAEIGDVHTVQQDFSGADGVDGGDTVEQSGFSTP